MNLVVTVLAGVLDVRRWVIGRACLWGLYFDAGESELSLLHDFHDFMS